MLTTKIPCICLWSGKHLFANKSAQELTSDPGSLLLQPGMHVQSLVAGFPSSVYETESVPNSNAQCPQCVDAQPAFFNTETLILSQRRHPYTGNPNPETPGDSVNAFLCWGDVLAIMLAGH